MGLPKGRERAFRCVQFFHDGGNAGQRAEMLRVQRQGSLKIRKCRPIKPALIKRRRPGVPALGEIGRVIGQGGQMLNRLINRATIQRVTSSLQQQVGRGRTRPGPFRDDPTFDPHPILLVRALKLGQKILDRLSHASAGPEPGDRCRDDKIENARITTHNREECSATARNYERPRGQIQGDSMSDVIPSAVDALNAKLAGRGFDGLAKFVIEDEGAIMIDEDGARAGDEEADVTLTASTETFRGMLEGDVNPTTAFMSGKLKVDGNMGLAMKLGSILG